MCPMKSRFIVFVALVSFCMISEIYAEENDYQKMLSIQDDTERSVFANGLDLAQLINLGDQASKADNFNFSFKMLTQVIYQHWKTQSPDPTMLLPVIQNIEDRYDPRWSAVIAMILCKYVGDWEPEEIMQYFNSALTNSRKTDISIAKQFYLQQSSIAFQNVLEKKVQYVETYQQRKSGLGDTTRPYNS